MHEDEADHDVRTFTTMTITTMVVHDDDYVMACLKMSAMLTLTNKYNHSDWSGRIRNHDWERFEAVRSAADESSIYIYICPSESL